MIRYVIDQPPIALKRARHYRGYVIDPSKPEKIIYQNTLRAAYPNIETICVPFSLNLWFYFPIPKSVGKKKRISMENTPHVKAVDLDNCIKFLNDMGNEFLWIDDALIWKICACKLYSEKPRVEIEIDCD